MVDSLFIILIIIGLSGFVLFAFFILWTKGNQTSFLPDFPIGILSAPRWTKKQLYTIAKEHNIRGRSKMSRNTLTVWQMMPA